MMTRAGFNSRTGEKIAIQACNVGYDVIYHKKALKVWDVCYLSLEQSYFVTDFLSLKQLIFLESAEEDQYVKLAVFASSFPDM